MMGYDFLFQFSFFLFVWLFQLNVRLFVDDWNFVLSSGKYPKTRRQYGLSKKRMERNTLVYRFSAPSHTRSAREQDILESHTYNMKGIYINSFHSFHVQKMSRIVACLSSVFFVFLVPCCCNMVSFLIFFLFLRPKKCSLHSATHKSIYILTCITSILS